ncbi:solute carrier family 2, facilitated glucose transporter member 3-like [Penaeus chinensis]|uniref:solute carrier family 2, facilitated glucose transporter member 3-like n=1 Tax=Penaeus chinensis TaxID=139456 RepID=UPI001FB798AA|nr:solute carrier family 2, facilitated glucose transporter member 3-like [Penaeus chinensis]
MTEKQLLEQSDSTSTPPTTKNSERGSKVTIWVLVALFSAVMGSSVPAGYSLGVINTPQEIIRSWLRVTVLQRYGVTLSASEEVSLWAVIVTLYVVGAIIGAPAGATVADRIGRRMALLCNHLLLMATALVLALCKGAGSVEMLFIGRFTSGLCSGNVHYLYCYYTNCLFVYVKSMFFSIISSSLVTVRESKELSIPGLNHDVCNIGISHQVICFFKQASICVVLDIGAVLLRYFIACRSIMLKMLNVGAGTGNCFTPLAFGKGLCKVAVSSVPKERLEIKVEFEANEVILGLALCTGQFGIQDIISQEHATKLNYCCNQTNIVVCRDASQAERCRGVLVSQIMGMDTILGTVDNWNYLLAAYAVFVAMALLLHPALPESPAYCYINARDEVRGRRELKRLYGKDDKFIEAEETALKVMAGMRNKAQNESSGWTFSQMIMNSKYRMPLAIAMIFNAGQQFSGINAVFFYSTLIFRSAGLDIQQSQGASIGAGVINCIMALAAAPLIKYCRRRVLLMTSIVLCIICQIGLMISLHLISEYQSASFVAIGALMAYVLFYGMGLGPIPFMIATELFPSGPRSVGISIGSTSNWMSNLVVGLTFPLLQVQFGELSFSFFIASSILLFIFVYRFLPETLGKDEPSSPPSSFEFFIDSDILETPPSDVLKNMI